MTPATHQVDDPLQALFAAEAGAHLACIGAGVAALDCGEGAALPAILDSLHTLGGAARAVDLFDLELLCRALERVFAAARDAGVAPVPGPAVGAALALAPQLMAEPAGRIRNHALAACTQLDALAARLIQSSQTA